MVMDMLITIIMVDITPYVHIPNDHIVYLQ